MVKGLGRGIGKGPGLSLHENIILQRFNAK